MADTNIYIINGSTQSIPECVSTAKEYFLSGEIDPLIAWANLSKFKKIIEQLQRDSDIIDYALRELSRYGKDHELNDCKLEEAEVGIKYDYSVCGSSRLQYMYNNKMAVDDSIKEMEKMLRSIPEGSEIADPETGEILKRPVRTSKTSIKVTFKK